MWPEARRVEIWGNETVVARIGLPRKKGKKLLFKQRKGIYKRGGAFLYSVKNR